MGGALKYVSDPKSVISGRMSGNVTVLGIGFGVDFDAKVEL
jgi:hypothetical protein